MFNILGKKLGIVCFGKRSKELNEGEKPKTRRDENEDHSGSEDLKASTYRKNKEKMFKMLYGDMKEDYNQIKGAGIRSTNPFDENASDTNQEEDLRGAGTGLEDSRVPKNTSGEISMAWEEAVNQDTGETYFINTITGEARGQGAPKSNRLGGKGQRTDNKENPPMNTYDDPLSPVREEIQDNQIRSPTTIGLHERPSLMTPSIRGGVGRVMTEEEEAKRKEGKKEEEDEDMEEETDGPDFFQAFASGVAGTADPTDISRLTTQKRVQLIVKRAQDDEHQDAIDVLFSANTNAPEVEPPWHRPSPPARPTLSKFLPADEFKNEPVNFPRPILQPPRQMIRPPASNGGAPVTMQSRNMTKIIPNLDKPQGGTTVAATVAATVVSQNTEKITVAPPGIETPSLKSPRVEKKDSDLMSISASIKIETDAQSTTTGFESNATDLMLAPGEEAENEVIANIIKGVETSCIFYNKKRHKEEKGLVVLEEDDADTMLKLAFNKSKHRKRPFKFKAYGGPLFENLRRIAGLNQDNFLRSLRGFGNSADIHQKRKGWYYFTHDFCMLVKSQTKRQHNTFRDMLPAYYNYVKENPGTLLEPILGCYRLDFKGRTTYITICKNIFYTIQTLHVRYKLKGVRSGRRASKNDLGRYEGLLKDDDFKDRKLYLGARKNGLLKQLESDTRFLASQKLVSYHVLLGIHEKKHTVTQQTDSDKNLERLLAVQEDEIFKHLELAQIKSIHPDGKEGKEIYFLGLTGLTKIYTGRRRMGSMIQRVIRSKEDIEVVDYEYYQMRLMKFMKDHIQ